MPKKHLYLHVGLPKTATSSLQTWLHENADTLAVNDISYQFTDNISMQPKHQFLVFELLNNNFSHSASVLEKTKTEAIIWSTEGLTNHLVDFSKTAFLQFRQLVASYQLTLIVT